MEIYIKIVFTKRSGEIEKFTFIEENKLESWAFSFTEN
jgi:hypothetical protein